MAVYKKSIDCKFSEFEPIIHEFFAEWTKDECKCIIRIRNEQQVLENLSLDILLLFKFVWDKFKFL